MERVVDGRVAAGSNPRTSAPDPAGSNLQRRQSLDQFGNPTPVIGMRATARAAPASNPHSPQRFSRSREAFGPRRSARELR